MIDPCDGCYQSLDSQVCKSCFFHIDSGLVLRPELFLSDEAYDFWEEYQSQLVLDQAGH